MRLTYLQAVIPLSSRKLYFCRIDYTLVFTPKNQRRKKEQWLFIDILLQFALKDRIRPIILWSGLNMS